ncbi:hypothetical protein O181_015000 [Austropuccinia psidii MF-1]|uniref:Uncharacterized protein n=1 Tax=Austropuccinia psidii MF-1 TaxID=1389203 RepID=A0A9Q3GQH4_9BASI|nr:hypothetical protein [Austropuccinia psidii MF-1]
MPKIPYTCPGSQKFTCKFLCLYRFPNIQTPYGWVASQQFQHFLMPVQAPDTSHAHPYSFTASGKFKQFLMQFQASNASHENPYACTCSKQFRQFLTLGQPPDNSKNSLHD